MAVDNSDEDIKNCKLGTDINITLRNNTPERITRTLSTIFTHKVCDKMCMCVRIIRCLLYAVYNY